MGVTTYVQVTKGMGEKLENARSLRPDLDKQRGYMNRRLRADRTHVLKQYRM